MTIEFLVFIVHTFWPVHSPAIFSCKMHLCKKRDSCSGPFFQNVKKKNGIKVFFFLGGGSRSFCKTSFCVPYFCWIPYKTCLYIFPIVCYSFDFIFFCILYLMNVLVNISHKQQKQNSKKLSKEFHEWKKERERERERERESVSHFLFCPFFFSLSLSLSHTHCMPKEVQRMN